MDTAGTRVEQAKRARGGRRRELSLPVMIPLCIAAFVGVTNLIAPAPFLDELAVDLDSSVPLVGQAMSIAMFTAAFVGLVAGPLADHSGHRRILLAGFVAAVVSSLGSALAPGFLSFMAARSIGGFASSMTIGVGFGAAAALYTGPARRRALSMIGASLSFGTALGPLVLTTLSEVIGWRGAFASVSVVAAVGVAALLLLFPADTPSNKGRFEIGRLLDSYRPLLKSQPMLLLYASWALRAVCWMGCISFLGALFDEQFGFSTRALGVVFLLAGGSYMAGSLTAGGRLGNYNLKALSLFALAGMGTGFLILFAVPLSTPAALGVLVLTTFIAGIAQTTMLTMIAERTPGGPSTTMMLTEMVVSIGAALGGVVAGVLLGAGGFVAMGVGLPVAALLSVVLISLKGREEELTPVDPQPASIGPS